MKTIKKTLMVMSFILMGLLICPMTVQADSEEYKITGENNEDKNITDPKNMSSKDYAIGNNPTVVATAAPTEEPENSVVDVLGDVGKNIFKNNIVNFVVLVILFIILAAVMHKNKKSKSDLK